VHSYYLAHPAREQKPSSQIHGATPFSICAICAHQNADLNGFHFNALPRAAFHFLSSLLTRALIARIHQSALRAAEKKIICLRVVRPLPRGSRTPTAAAEATAAYGFSALLLLFLFVVGQGLPGCYDYLVTSTATCK
jgi:hypothetical protein